ncbi:hypothetical protein L798_15493 [Zootermopsis nevadensis]|uniref:Uncharacterized protein n=1 Tax=Zootermopsis nevadensis TaxID=136037 RepID=A0A067QPM9_ZOONE|nr:hypothetical protein L798_15493 [Zootermopsis nevadensis]
MTKADFTTELGFVSSVWGREGPLAQKNEIRGFTYFRISGTWNSVFKPSFFYVHFNIIPPRTSGCPSLLLPSDFRLKFYIYLSSRRRVLHAQPPPAPPPPRAMRLR